ncbi:MAG: efflux RND transporter periplasmic adaptor subunit [Myxococcota bacterium]|nr:efflux RND transporter periplasmic adaptor subunit [Myxococcota bacterium]
MFYTLWVVLISCEEVKPQEVKEVDIRPRVRMTSVESKTFSRPIRLSATLKAHRSAVLVPKSPGRVSKVHVRIGDDVQEGDLLMEIEDFDYQAAYQEAKATMELAELQAKHAHVQRKRFEALFAEKAVTEYQLEEVRLNTELADGQALRANAGFQIAKSRLDGTKLKAPFSGSIVSRNVERGEMLGGPTSRPPLMIADVAKMRVVTDIAEHEIDALKDSRASFKVSPQDEVEIVFERINRAVDPVIHTIQIESTIDNASRTLRHGESVEVVIIPKEQSLLSIPREALIESDGGTATVFTVQDDRAVARKVQYGSSDTTDVPILQGLEKGEAVLVSGHTRLKDGETVVVLDKE